MGGTMRRGSWIAIAAVVLVLGAAAALLFLPASGPGAHLVLEADFARYWHEQGRALSTGAGNTLAAGGIGFTLAEPAPGALSVTLSDSAQAPAARKLLADYAGPDGYAVSAPAPDRLLLSLPPDARHRAETHVIEETIAVLQRRLAMLGVGGTVTSTGGSRLAVAAQGNPDPAAFGALLVAEAKMSFRLVDDKARASALASGQVPPGETVLMMRDGGRIAVFDRVLLGGRHVVDAVASRDPTGEPAIDLRLDEKGAALFYRITSGNIGRELAIVLDDKVLMAPVIHEPIAGGSIQVAGSFTEAQAIDLAALLRGGALAVPLHVVPADR